MNELKLIRNIKIKSENAELTYECYYILTYKIFLYNIKFITLWLSQMRNSENSWNIKGVTCI